MGVSQYRQQQYAAAVNSFTIVFQHFERATQEVQRAQNGLVDTYLSWSDQLAGKQDYAGATAHYDILLAQSYCGANSSCASIASASDATAYFHLGEQLFT